MGAWLSNGIPCLDSDDAPVAGIRALPDCHWGPFIPDLSPSSAIRVDPDVLEQFRKEARRRRIDYQILMNEALAEHIRKDVA